MAYVPDAIQAAYDTIHAAMPQAQLSGIYANKPGYHNCRANLPSSDYSVQKSYDKEGDGQAASGLDVTFNNPADMKAITQRLINETKANGDGGALYGLREFFGTTDGYNVTGMDVPGQYYVTSDPSHLWHIHLSGKRKYVNDHAAWQRAASIVVGGGSGGTPDNEDEEMPKNVAVQRNDTFALGTEPIGVTWQKEIEDDGKMFDLASMPKVIQLGGHSFVSTFSCNATDLPSGKSLYTAIRWTDKYGNDKGAGAWHEFPSDAATRTYAVDTRALKCANGDALKIWMQADVPCTIAGASWRCLYW